MAGDPGPAYGKILISPLLISVLIKSSLTYR